MDLKVRVEKSTLGRTPAKMHLVGMFTHVLFISALQGIICVESFFLNYVDC